VGVVAVAGTAVVAATAVAAVIWAAASVAAIWAAASRVATSAAGFHFSGGELRGHQRHAYGWRHPGSYYDYGYDNGYDDSCLGYPPYYRRYQWGCTW